MKAMYLCSRSEKCKSDIRKKLYDWKANPNSFDKIIQTLEKQNFLNEERYAKMFVKDKFKFNKWGKYKIKAALIQKQISEKTINAAIGIIDDNEYIEMLKNLINSKLNKLSEEDPNMRKQKILSYASAKGFEPNLIKKFLN
jgi:regulatory protein